MRIRKKREERASERNLWEEGGGATLEIRTVVTEKGKVKFSIWLGSGGVGVSRATYQRAFCVRRKRQKASSSAGLYY